MMAGTNFNISYMNRAALQMKSVAESDLPAVLPNFNANNLMGSNIDVFNKNPTLERLTEVYRD